MQDDTAWSEWETPIAHPHELEKLLLQNGCILVTVIKKQRMTYRYQSFTINVDAIDGLGLFVEIECISDDAEKARSEIMKFLQEKLQLKKDAIITKGYVKLMLKE